MSSWVERGAATALALAGLLSAIAATPAGAADAPAWAGLGRSATPAEIAAWNIDVRPDFKGLPAGRGTVAQGQVIWEAKCASCHGVFGESRDVFAPIVGGTTKADVQSGHVARLKDPAYPERTAMMKLNSVSTLWDFINRAMPWNAPKSLSTDEVYAVVAFILNLAEVVPDDFVLDQRSIAQAQARLPNRLGMSTDHGLWPGPEIGHRKPDVSGSACMRQCGPAPQVASQLPDYARNAHGNLAEQNRLVGPQRGADTTRAPGAAPQPRSALAAAAAPAVATAAAHPARALYQSRGCAGCHAVDGPLVGPALREVGKRYGGRADAQAYLSQKIRAGGSGVWGAIPMPPQSLSDDDLKALAAWIADGVR